MAKGARGVSPADVPYWFVSIAACSKAFERWGSFWSWCSCCLALVMAMAAAEEGGDDGDERWPLQVQEILRASL